MIRRRTRDNDLVRVWVIQHQETDKAIMVSDDGDDGNAVWIPKSQVQQMEEVSGDIIEIEIPEWLAEREGLI